MSGFRELEKALAELPKATGKNVLRKIARGALEPMADIAASKAPEGTGNLAFSISVSEKRTRRAKKSTTVYLGNGRFRSAASTGVEVAMGPAGGTGALYYATFQEFGRIDQAASPFMRPAWDAGAERALEYVKTNLAVEIDKAAARYAKRLAKRGG